MTINTNPDIHNLVICSNVFVRKEGKYLVLRRSPAKKYLPNVVQPIGGKVELNENPYQAAIREAREEAGVEINNLKLEACSLEIHPYSREIKNNWFIFYFSADWLEGEIKQTDEGELLILTEEELITSNLFLPLRRMIKHILRKDDGTVFATFEFNNDMTEIIKEDIKVCSI